MTDARCAVVIEDDVDVRELTELVLTQSGFTVVAAADGPEPGSRPCAQHQPAADHPRRPDARDGRVRGGQAAARVQPHLPDHDHLDGLRDRHHPGLRGRRRRLPGQAVPPARAAGPRRLDAAPPGIASGAGVPTARAPAPRRDVLGRPARPRAAARARWPRCPRMRPRPPRRCSGPGPSARPRRHPLRPRRPPLPPRPPRLPPDAAAAPGPSGSGSRAGPRRRRPQAPARGPAPVLPEPSVTARRAGSPRHAGVAARLASPAAPRSTAAPSTCPPSRGRAAQHPDAHRPPGAQQGRPGAGPARPAAYVTSHFVNEADKRPVDAHVASLRAKLGDDGDHGPLHRDRARASATGWPRLTRCPPYERPRRRPARTPEGAGRFRVSVGVDRDLRAAVGVSEAKIAIGTSWVTVALGERVPSRPRVCDRRPSR